jgi:hypothetical protein
MTKPAWKTGLWGFAYALLRAKKPQGEFMGKPFYLHNRGGIFYACLVNKETGERHERPFYRGEKQGISGYHGIRLA